MDFQALLLIIALVCFVFAAIPAFPVKWQWLAIGLAFFTAGHVWSSLIIKVQ